jgi:uncharacterized protein (UPF0264 family)
MSELLVSVRSAAEAEAALAGGAGLIDVKEPARGPLGRADGDTVGAVVGAVMARRPVSAALGELRPTHAGPAGEWRGAVAGLPPGLRYVKWGLAGYGDDAGWRTDLAASRAALEETAPGCEAVAVAYADWQSARAPRPDHVVALARAEAWPALLLDTWAKDGRTLLDWLTVTEVHRLAQACREARVRVALAGSLGPGEIVRLREISPEWFAVRSAVCEGSRRQAAVSRERVRALVQLLARPTTHPAIGCGER